MRRTATLAALSICVWTITPTAALAWGSPGHQYVGNVAWKLLNPNARAHVKSLLGPGVSLAEAAVWPDCIRSVDGSPTNGFSYTSDQYTPAACDVFGNSASERARMTDYASRNWINCDYSGQPLKCNLSYHFADVNARRHSDYQLGYFGTGTNDVVQAIKAATAVLKCPSGQTCTPQAPFNIRDKREALFLLAHFVGDVHQPLHVGAVYLDAGNGEGDDNGQPTSGGNYLLLSPGDKPNNLHHAWDTVVASIGSQPSATAIASACQISPLPNPTPEAPEKWAGESVVEAQTAYDGMTFIPDTSVNGRWDVQFTGAKANYTKTMRKTQARRLIQGGARLASILNSVWPSNTPASACS
jgi:S1/P1 nuclease